MHDDEADLFDRLNEGDALLMHLNSFCSESHYWDVPKEVDRSVALFELKRGGDTDTQQQQQLVLAEQYEFVSKHFANIIGLNYSTGLYEIPNSSHIGSHSRALTRAFGKVKILLYHITSFTTPPSISTPPSIVSPL